MPVNDQSYDVRFKQDYKLITNTLVNKTINEDKVQELCIGITDPNPVSDFFDIQVIDAKSPAAFIFAMRFQGEGDNLSIGFSRYALDNTELEQIDTRQKNYQFWNTILDNFLNFIISDAVDFTLCSFNNKRTIVDNLVIVNNCASEKIKKPNLNLIIHTSIYEKFADQIRDKLTNVKDTYLVNHNLAYVGILKNTPVYVYNGDVKFNTLVMAKPSSIGDTAMPLAIKDIEASDGLQFVNCKLIPVEGYQTYYHITK